MIYVLLFFTLSCVAVELRDLQRLKQAYPEHIKAVSEQSIIWHDDKVMPLGDITHASESERLNNPSLADQIKQVYRPGALKNIPTDDPGRIRYEPFFRKMYGNCPEEVESHLVTMHWLSGIFGRAYPLKVTTINNVDKKIRAISHELEQLVKKEPQKYLKFIARPGGTFNWRMIANTTRLSNHSFGMTIDINPQHSEYWQWDLKKNNRTVSEEEKLEYRNTIPSEIVELFEKHGFIWGGKWYHYDMMHFEYRPELFITDQD